MQFLFNFYRFSVFIFYYIYFFVNLNLMLLLQIKLLYLSFLNVQFILARFKGRDHTHNNFGDIKKFFQFCVKVH